MATRPDDLCLGFLQPGQTLRGQPSSDPLARLSQCMLNGTRLAQ
jgi:hypothetical protein